MAMTLDTNVLLDGRKKYVVRLQGIAGAADNETAAQKVDISTLTGPDGKAGLAPSYFAVEKIKWNTDYDAVTLLFDATTDDQIATLTGEGEMVFDPPFNDPQSTGSTGDIMLTSVGGAANKSYDITLTLIKKQ